MCFYHYTDEVGLNAIKACGYIKQSENLDNADDAVFGTGTIVRSALKRIDGHQNMTLTQTSKQSSKQTSKPTS